MTKSKRIAFGFCLLLSLCTGIAAAQAPMYTYVRTIDLGAPLLVDRMTCACSDQTGGLYFTDNGDDKIYYIPNVLTAAATTNDIITVYDLMDPVNVVKGGTSWMGITFDGKDVYTSAENRGRTVLMRISRTGPNAWQRTLINMPEGSYGGCSAVGVGRLVMPDYQTGALNFFTINGDSAQLEPGCPIQGGGGTAIQAFADLQHGRIFISRIATNQTGGVRVFTSNGTPAGTSFNQAANPVVADVPSSHVEGDQALHYQNICVDPTDNIMIVSQNSGKLATDTVKGWAAFDLSKIATNMTPVQFIDGRDTPQGQIQSFGDQDTAYGSSFLSIGGQTYLALCRSFSTQPGGKIYIYKKGGAAAPSAAGMASAPGLPAQAQPAAAAGGFSAAGAPAPAPGLPAIQPAGLPTAPGLPAAPGAATAAAPTAPAAPVAAPNAAAMGFPSAPALPAPGGLPGGAAPATGLPGAAPATGLPGGAAPTASLPGAASASGFPVALPSAPAQAPGGLPGMNAAPGAAAAAPPPAAPPAKTDKLYHNDGTVIEGKIASETADNVKIDTKYGTFSYARTELAKVERADGTASGATAPSAPPPLAAGAAGVGSVAPPPNAGASVAALPASSSSYPSALPSTESGMAAPARTSTRFSVPKPGSFGQNAPARQYAAPAAPQYSAPAPQYAAPNTQYSPPGGQQYPASGSQYSAPPPSYMAPAQPVGASSGASGEAFETIVLTTGKSFTGIILKKGMVWEILLPNGSIIKLPATRVAAVRTAGGQ